MKLVWTVVTALTLLGARALTIGRFPGTHHAPKFIEVKDMMMRHRDLASNDTLEEDWTMSISVKSTKLKFHLNSLRTFMHEDFSSWITSGETLVFKGGEWQRVGWSRMIFSCVDSSSVELSPSDSQYVAQGTFEILGEVWHLTKAEDAGFIIWKESSLDGTTLELPVDFGGAGTAPQNSLEPRAAEEGGSPSTEDLLASIGNTSGCPKVAHTARIGVAADLNFMNSFNSTLAAKTHIVDTVNKASRVWEQAFNISLEVGQMVVANDSYEAPWNIMCDDNNNTVTALQSRLNAMTQWRSSKDSRREDGMVQWTLFTHCPSGNVVGLAWQGMACSPSGINVVDHSVLDYRVLAHETGHIFGAVHDCTSSSCEGNEEESDMDVSGGSARCCPFSNSACDASGQFIMNPASAKQQFMFSPCTQGNVCDAIGSGTVNSSCLIPKQSLPTRNSSVCGADLSSEDYAHCRRNTQCIELTGRQDSYACGPSDSCALLCFDKETQRCVAHGAFKDMTPCGRSGRYSQVCIEARCKRLSREFPTWLWVVIFVVSIGGVAILLGLWLIFVYMPKKTTARAGQQAIEQEGTGPMDTKEHFQESKKAELEQPSDANSLDKLASQRRSRRWFAW